jgi:DNA repair protein RadD
LQLRDYQLRALDEVRRKMAAGVKRICVVSPTGSGKTIMFCEITRLAIERKRRVVVLAHRKELIDQSVDKLLRFGIFSGVVMAQDSRRDDYFDVQVCSIQTLARRVGPSDRMPRTDRLPPADVVIVDECHHAPSDSYRKVLAAWPDAVVLGFTATPWRTDKIGLRGLFDDSLLVATYAELMERGHLVYYDAFAYDAPDLHDVKMVAGEYNQRELGLACNTQVLVGSIVREYLTHARGRRAIVFPVNIEHSRSLVREFQSAGVVAEHVDCDTPKLERERILAGLGSGAITVVSSVGVLTEGFDCPAVEVVILGRPTQSLSLHLQMIGRGLRPADGKGRALIHDHAGNLLRHGFPEDERDYSLTVTPKRTRDLHTCPICCAIFGSVKADGTCPKCGELIAPPREPGDSGAAREDKEQIEGERLSAEQIRLLRDRGLRADLTDAQVARASRASTTEKKAEYLRLLEVVRLRGFQKGFAGHKFREVFGHWPNYSPAQLEGVTPASKPFFPLPPKVERAEREFNPDSCTCSTTPRPPCGYCSGAGIEAAS